jgi:hypothetical protein
MSRRQTGIEMKNKLQPLLLIDLVEGVAALLFLLFSPSKEQGLLWGYSAARLALIALMLLGLAALVFLVLRMRGHEDKVVEPIASSRDFILSLAIVLLLASAGIALIALQGNWLRFGNVGGYLQRGWPLALWVVLMILQLQGWMLLNGIHAKWKGESLISFTLTAAVIVFISFDTLLRTNGINPGEFLKFAKAKLIPALPFLFLLAALTFWLARLGQRRDKTIFILAARAISIFLFAWLAYQLTGFIGRWYFREPAQAYFPYLAEAFLHGRLYLENPISLVELTPNNGYWYVPYPPLVAVLMMPMTAVRGAANVNSSNFSIFFAALCVSLVFLILEKMRQRGWIKLNTTSNLWLAVLFGFSTPYWQIAVSGEVWYINQVVTVAFVALATLLVLYEAPPVWIGLSLALALLARPPILLSWIFLFGIYWQIQKDKNGNVPFTKWFKWGFYTAIPIVMIGLGFLWYNYARFASPFDFGYAAMNIGEPARTDIRTYGQFNFRYLARNLEVMFLRLPHWKAACGFFTADGEGMSMFVATPALIYVFGAFKRREWILGAWASSALLILPLMLYFTTGIFQFGYRYILDLFIPLLTLIAVSIGRDRLPLHVKALILAGILVNYWGVWWFYRHWCR